MSLKKVLFVCKSNFCRSPLAQGLLEAAVTKRGLKTAFEIDSAGTHDYQIGLAPDKNVQDVAVRYGIDISHQTARQIQVSDFTYFDHILVMDCQNKNTLLFMCPPALHYKIELLMSYAPDGRQEEVLDPYQRGQQGFEQMYGEIKKAALGFLESCLSA